MDANSRASAIKVIFIRLLKHHLGLSISPEWSLSIEAPVAGASASVSSHNAGFTAPRAPPFSQALLASANRTSLSPIAESYRALAEGKRQKG